MKKLLNQKEQHYADTLVEAKEIVVEAQEKGDLIMNKISEKHNKYGQYFLVDLTYQYGTPKEVMEGKPDDAPDGQLTIDEVEPAADEIDDLSDIEFEDIPDEDVTPENLPF